MAPSSDNSSTMMLSPKKTVTFAVNYQKSMLDQFCLSTASPRSVKQSSALAVELVENSTAAPDDINPTRSSASATQRDFAPDGMENSAPNTPLPNNNKKTMNSIPNDKTVTATSNDDNMNNNNNNKNVSIKTPTTERQRRSTRELKKKEATMERARVRYDVQLVPSVKRNRAFLDRFPLWMVPPPTPEEKMKVMQHRQQQIQKEQQQQLIAAQQKQEAAKQHKLIEDDKAALQDVEEVSTKSTTGSSVSADPNAPFAEDTSVVWIPKKRSEWEDCVQEMTAVCTSASLRRHMATGGRSSSSKPFYQPLSLAYLKDRIDIDDPLNGYQIRHKEGGWLQGFILWTNFTTWTHYFKWDSSHAMSGIPTMSNSGAKVDADGSLANLLESQPRSGDPFEGGVVHEGVAEISLVGGLGCGEYLLRMALDAIRKRKTYKFVVLQATDSSKAWYERFGFIRVGCVCKFLRDQATDPSKPNTRQDTPIMGYRHWTHPNESDSSLQKHGGPSYMMCLKLPEDDPNESVETPFLDEMLKLQVSEKPTIEQLGGSSTPYPKTHTRRGSMDSSSSTSSTDSHQMLRTGAKRKSSTKGRRGSGTNPSPTAAPSFGNTTTTQSAPVLPVLRGSNVASDTPARNLAAGTKRNAPKTSEQSSKRRRLSPIPENEQGKKGTTVGSISAPKTADSKKNTKSKAATPISSSSSTERPSSMKQKVKSYPRDRVHFFNKVVRPKGGRKSENYFVLHYDEPKGTIRIIPMEARGLLSGKRAGRPRFQAMMENYNRDVRTVHCKDYDIVDAFMVMKTPVVASEAWDILDA